MLLRGVPARLRVGSLQEQYPGLDHRHSVLQNALAPVCASLCTQGPRVLGGLTPGHLVLCPWLGGNEGVSCQALPAESGAQCRLGQLP